MRRLADTTKVSVRTYLMLVDTVLGREVLWTG